LLKYFKKQPKKITMKRILLLLCLVVVLLSSKSLKGFNPPDEGMWLPMFVERLNYVDMKNMGLNLTAEELYSINNSSLKDAIVNFGNFCTAEVVSPEGLLLTNHHCGYGAIQAHSSIDHDYLTNGFWAYSKSEELENQSLTATFLVRMEDVTATVLAELNSSMNETERNAAVRKAITKLEKDNSEKGAYDVSVKGFFNGNEYYMFIYKTYKDIRLVGAPPSSIGKFGGDTDNWMWPRHTGDFAMFRIYTAPDGSPAVYNKDNVPMKSVKYLPVSLKGVKKDDFAMIWGFPGRTDRFLSSYGIKLALEQINPAIIKMGDNILEIMKDDMGRSDNVRIMYAAGYAQVANFWKNKIGESRGLKRLDVYSKKKELEDRFEVWVAKDADRKTKYGEVIPDMASAYQIMTDTKDQQTLWYFQLSLMGCKALSFPLQLQGLPEILKRKGDKQIALEPFIEKGKTHYKDYNAQTEQKLLARVLEIFYKDVAPEYHPAFFGMIAKKYKGDFNLFAADVFKKSVLASEDKYMAFMKKPTLKTLENDLLYTVSNGLLSTYLSNNEKLSANRQKLNKARRLFVEGVLEMEKDKVFYPDANSTLRMSYGKVLDYYPADAVHYNYYTTLTGLMSKEDPGNDEFVVPEKLKELFQNKDFGDYAVNGDIPVCFISNNDITGGNSGSPVLNGDGHLIGIAFDGNWEAMSGDIAFEPELQRTISVDIRYVLFIIDKYAGAKNLIDEMTIIR